MTKYDPPHETTEVDHDGVVAALEGFVGDYVHVHIEDGETLMGTVATAAVRMGSIAVVVDRAAQTSPTITPGQAE